MDWLSEIGGGMTMMDVAAETTQQWIDWFVNDTLLFINIAYEDGDPKDVRFIYKPRSYTRSKYDIIQKNSMTSNNFFRQNV
jgi:hypothetical protein